MMLNTVILLIDFRGHPILGDDYVNNHRYGEIQRLMLRNSGKVKKEDILFVSNNGAGYDKKLNELFKMAELINFNTLQLSENYDGDYTVDEIIDIIFKMTGYKIDSKFTQIIIGGCNLGGCVTNAKNISAINWSKLNFKTTIHLPLCAEYEQPGSNQVERVCGGFREMYTIIRDNKAFDIRVTDHIKQLKI